MVICCKYNVFFLDMDTIFYFFLVTTIFLEKNE